MLEIKNLTKTFGAIKAVDNISFNIMKGEILGLVGESGSGKTTLGRMLLRLISAASGEVIYNEKEVFSMNKVELKAFRRVAQIIFQDPYTSLNPRLSVGETLAEPMLIHSLIPRDKIDKSIAQHSY